jgi:cob(I)alamin adenosyltransferase
MKIYTKKGDKGYSSLYDGTCARKSDPVFDVLGASDELTSHVGMLWVLVKEAFEGERLDIKVANVNMLDILRFLRNIQENLQLINSEIATPDEMKRAKLKKLDGGEVGKLEDYIDSMESFNDKLMSFILPGSGKPDAQAHICRTATRRLEREICRAGCKAEIESAHIRCYVNRLSDFFFVFARSLCKLMNLHEFKCKF